MRLIITFTILLVVTSVSAAIHHHSSMHLRHHKENTEASSTIQRSQAASLNRTDLHPSRTQKLIAITSRPPQVRRRRPGGIKKVGRNATTVLQRRNSIYFDVPDYGQDTWRRGAEDVSTTKAPPTETILLTNRGKNFNKSHDGRHICIQHKTIQVPVKTTEVYSRPTWRHVSEPCHINQICTTLKMFQEPAYRDIIRHQTTKQIVYDCCPGWEQPSKSSSGCTKPVCKTKCRNGGTCLKPDTCGCPKGFTGKYCELDINECKEHKPCDQFCYNTEGSYYCKCREGFVLHSDGQSCKKLGSDGDTNGIEARDLENEIDQDSDSLLNRLHKVEKMIATDKVAANELHKTVEAATNMVESLKTRIDSLERKDYELNSIQDKLRNYEAQSRKLEHLVGVLFKCRKAPNAYCP